jgi:hypothetical protein
MLWPLKQIFLDKMLLKIHYVPYAEQRRRLQGMFLWGCPGAKAIWSMCSSKIQIRCIKHEEFCVYC